MLAVGVWHSKPEVLTSQGFPPFLILRWAERRAPKTERLITFHAPASLGDVAGEEPATEWRQREQTSTSAGAEQISFSLTEGQVWLEGGGGGGGTAHHHHHNHHHHHHHHHPTLSLSPSPSPSSLFSPFRQGTGLFHVQEL